MKYSSRYVCDNVSGNYGKQRVAIDAHETKQPKGFLSLDLFYIDFQMNVP
jgi:hypothetical protein